MKDKGDIFLLEEQHGNFVAATKVKMSGNDRKVLEVSRCSRARQRQRNVQKVCCTCKVAFLLIRPIIVFFTVLVSFAA